MTSHADDSLETDYSLDDIVASSPASPVYASTCEESPPPPDTQMTSWQAESEASSSTVAQSALMSLFYRQKPPCGRRYDCLTKREP